MGGLAGDASAHTFTAVITRGLDYRKVFQELRPGFDLNAERETRAAAGQPEYPDVRDSLAALRADGLWLGIAGNQTVRVDIASTSSVPRWNDPPVPFVAERPAAIQGAENGRVRQGPGVTMLGRTLLDAWAKHVNRIELEIRDPRLPQKHGTPKPRLVRDSCSRSIRQAGAHHGREQELHTRNGIPHVAQGGGLSRHLSQHPLRVAPSPTRAAQLPDGPTRDVQDLRA